MDRKDIASLISFDDEGQDVSTGYVDVSPRREYKYPDTIDELIEQYEGFMKGKGYFCVAGKYPDRGELYFRFIEPVIVRFGNTRGMVEDNEYGVPVLIKLMQFGPNNGSTYYAFQTPGHGYCCASVNVLDYKGDYKYTGATPSELDMCGEIKKLTQEFGNKFETPNLG